MGMRNLKGRAASTKAWARQPSDVRRLRALLLTGVAGISVASAMPVWAAEVVVTSGSTVGQQVLNPGDTLIVNGGGTVSSAIEAVTDTAAGSITILNRGIIQSTGALAAAGIAAGQSSVGFQNWGTISGVYKGISANRLLASQNIGSVRGGDYGILTSTVDSFDNRGTITGDTQTGFRADTIVNFLNSGIVTGGGYGLVGQVDLLALTNSGTITGINNNGVDGEHLGVLNNSGTIYGGSDGIHALNNIASLTNTGTITGGGAGVAAMNGAIGTVNNSGTISGQAGIESQLSIASLVNSGTISGTGMVGVFSNQDMTSVVNTGSILADGVALNANGSLVALTNAGTISGGQAILANDINAVRNSGTIVGLFIGMEAVGTIGTVVNSGTIRGGVYAITAKTINSITNSGLVAGGDATQFAINETGAGDTILALDAGSTIIGHVQISSGSDTLRVGNGLNLALTFDTSVPELISTAGAPYVVKGNTVYVADLAAFASAGVATANLTSSIATVVANAADKGFDEKGIDDAGRYWAQGIGGLDHEDNGNHAGFGGFVLGGDFGSDARVGFFLGGARGVLEDKITSIDTSSFYAGIYGKGEIADLNVTANLTGGYAHGANARTIADNTVSTGLRTASSSGGGYFISPGITFTKPWVTGDLTAQTSLAFNYTGLFSQGFDEGTANGVILGQSASHVLETEALLRLPFEHVSEGGVLTGDVHAGLEARAVINPSLNGTLAGGQVTFSQASSYATAGLVVGGKAEFAMSGGLALFGGADATLRSDGSASLTANAGLKASF